MSVLPPSASNPVPSLQEVQLNTGTYHLESDSKLVLSTDGIFRTIQGEGPRLGRNTCFIRLAGCNLACSWCDTAYTWDWKGVNGHEYHVKKEVLVTPLNVIA